ncbi:hypothetical protein AURDEDRAFT_168370 [Auricularia subglabra TFB-10046 SS5]|nr:hypothetical protein AURDEDRAFT_168370 [Auricularia subglabra TFB-10046 SS5]
MPFLTRFSWVGILYFFARPKVDVGDDPHGADDIQRSFLVLRPIDGHDDTGPAPKDAICRILVVPKKKLPSPSKHDRFLTFVKEPEVTVAGVAEQFKSETYMTKTKGERTQPAAVPIAEAVYALIASGGGKATHLAYMLTIPDKLDAVQTELGISKEGSFVAQVRNPKFPAPPQAGIPEPPSYPDEIMDAFEGKRWMPLKPKHLKFKHAEILLIGAHADVARNGKEGEAPVKEMEELEHEEEHRVEKLGEDDAVFKDLRLRAQEFKKELSFGGTWAGH